MYAQMLQVESQYPVTHWSATDGSRAYVKDLGGWQVARAAVIFSVADRQLRVLNAGLLVERDRHEQHSYESEMAATHDGLTELEVLPDMHSRKARMAELADGIVVLPGGFGTYEEAFEVLTWNQLGIISTPIVFLDVTLDQAEASFYDPLFDFIDGAVAAGFMKPQHGGLAQRAATPDEAVSIAAGPAPDFTRKWVS